MLGLPMAAAATVGGAPRLPRHVGLTTPRISDVCQATTGVYPGEFRTWRVARRAMACSVETACRPRRLPGMWPTAPETRLQSPT